MSDPDALETAPLPEREPSASASMSEFMEIALRHGQTARAAAERLRRLREQHLEE